MRPPPKNFPRPPNKKQSPRKPVHHFHRGLRTFTHKKILEAEINFKISINSLRPLLGANIVCAPRGKILYIVLCITYFVYNIFRISILYTVYCILYTKFFKKKYFLSRPREQLGKMSGGRQTSCLGVNQFIILIERNG